MSTPPPGLSRLTAADWDQWNSTSQPIAVGPAETEDFLQAVAPRSGTAAVDLACGTGQWTRRLAGWGPTVIGYDFSGEALRLARASPPCADTAYKRWDVVAEPIPRCLVPGRFDVVTCRYSLPYLQPGRLLTDVGRWLKPGGVFYALTRVHPGDERSGLQPWKVEPGRPSTKSFQAGFSNEEFSAIGAGWTRREVRQVGRYGQALVLGGYGRPPHPDTAQRDQAAATAPAA